MEYTDGDTVAEYEYNADNLRTAKTVNGRRTDYVWDGTNLRYETGGNGTHEYVYDPTGVHMMDGNYYVKDGHGNVTSMYDEDAEFVSDTYYDAFGNIAYGDTPNPFGYSGEYHDSETGLIYLRNRYYDSSTGRFITEDPAKDGVNWYSYCGGDPVNAVDPWGLEDRTTAGEVGGFVENTDKVDEQGVQILLWYLFGEGENRFIDNDPEWTEYMESNSILTTKVRNILIEIFNGMENGSSQWINITTSMEIENGENIVGYEYLHGTNGDLSHYKALGATVDDVGFRIIGSINKDANGSVTFSLIFEWNDIIDPNPQYTTDIEKSNFAKEIADPQDYILRIKWNSSGSYHSHDPSSLPGWPFNYFDQMIVPIGQ